MRVDFFIILGQMWGDLINEHPRSQGIVGRCTVPQLALVLDPTNFLTNRS
jgi:hypothetical protein